MNIETTGRRRALITGASSGIVAAFAERLGRDGLDLIIVARRRERLESLSERLRRNHGASTEVIAADLTDRFALGELEKRVASDSSIELLVNNAGFGGYGEFASLAPDVAEGLIALHVLALTRNMEIGVEALLSAGGRYR